MEHQVIELSPYSVGYGQVVDGRPRDYFGLVWKEFSPEIPKRARPDMADEIDALGAVCSFCGKQIKEGWI